MIIFWPDQKCEDEKKKVWSYNFLSVITDVLMSNLLYVTPLWNPCLIIVTTVWCFSRSRDTVKSQWALAALFQRVKMNNSFPETTNVLFSRTGPSQSSLLGQLLLLQMAKPSSLSSGRLPGVFWPKQQCFTFSTATVPGNPTLLDGLSWLVYTNTALGIKDSWVCFYRCGCAYSFQGLLLWIFSLNVTLGNILYLCSKTFLLSFLLFGHHRHVPDEKDIYIMV